MLQKLPMARSQSKFNAFPHVHSSGRYQYLLVAKHSTTNRIHPYERGENLGRWYNTFIEQLIRRPTLKVASESLALLSVQHCLHVLLPTE